MTELTPTQFETFIGWLEQQRDEATLLSERQRTINDVLEHLGRNGLVVSEEQFPAAIHATVTGLLRAEGLLDPEDEQ